MTVRKKAKNSKTEKMNIIVLHILLEHLAHLSIYRYETLCQVKSNSQDAAANANELSLLPYASSVPLSSVVHRHRKRRSLTVFIHRVTCYD